MTYTELTTEAGVKSQRCAHFCARFNVEMTILGDLAIKPAGTSGGFFPTRGRVQCRCDTIIIADRSGLK